MVRACFLPPPPRLTNPPHMQMTALMDMIQAALMLKYNGRKIG